MGAVKDQIMSLFKAKDCIQPKRVKTVYEGGKKQSKLKIQNQFEDDVIKNIRNQFELKKESKTKKDRTINDIETLFQQQDKNYLKPVKVGNLLE